MKPEANRIILRALRNLVKTNQKGDEEHTKICKLINTFKCDVHRDIQAKKVEDAVKAAKSVANMVNSIFTDYHHKPVPPFKNRCWDVHFVRHGDRDEEIKKLAVLVPFSYYEIESIMSDNKANIIETKEACKIAEKFGISLQEALGMFRISVQTGLNLDKIKFV